jgi:hypothetical protein
VNALIRLLNSHAWHLPLVVALSALYESRFIHHWLNVVDEGWPLYAAMQMQHGRALYRDALFVFPPGHLLAAWVGYALDPPGVVVARMVYAAFNVALCAAIYALGRRLMPARYALFGALLLAVAAPLSHRAHLLFGYRYLVFSVLALLAFSRRLSTGDGRWMFAAGCCVGVGLCFRQDPGVALSVGIGVGVLAAGADWRAWLRDAAWYAGGAALFVLPVFAWLVAGVGLETLWREVVVRPLVMTRLQSLPLPDLVWPVLSDRDSIHDAFVALLFRAVPLLYLVYAGKLLLEWRRARAEGARFAQALLLAVVVWGGIYFFRSLGRSDEPHLSSAIPPFCLLLAHAAYSSLRALWSRGVLATRWRGAASGLVCAALFSAWVLLPGADRVFDPRYRGSTPFEPIGDEVLLRAEDWWHVLTPKLAAIRERLGPDEQILDLSAQSLLYVLLDRMGPGRSDIVMPGTFLDEGEELAFVTRLKETPPALVILFAKPFDEMRSRSLARIAPRLMGWVARNYSPTGDPEDYVLLAPRQLREFPDSPAAARASEPTTRAAPTLGAFWQEDAARARARLELVPLDPQREVDRALLELMVDIETHQVTELLRRFSAVETPLGWGSPSGSLAHLDLGIALDRRLERALEPASTRERLLEAARFLLAHQLAHLMQLQTYTLESLSRASNLRAVEAQADLLSGVVLAQNRIFAGRGWAGFRADLERGLGLSKELGHPLPPALELRDEERRRLVGIGVELGIFRSHAWTCLTNLGEPEGGVYVRGAVKASTQTGQEVARLFSGSAGSGFAPRPEGIALPRLDPRTCDSEDVFDWTRRAAALALGAP